MVSVAALRRYVVAHQGYASRFRRARIDDVAAAIARLQAVQLDSIATVDRAHRITLATRVGAYVETDVSALLARGPQLRVLGARGVPAADRGLPAVQAADAGAEGPPLVGPRAHRRGPQGRAPRARADPRGGRAAGARVRGPQRADVGLEAGEARARASLRRGRARDRGTPGLPARLRPAGARDPGRVSRRAGAVGGRVPPPLRPARGRGTRRADRVGHRRALPLQGRREGDPAARRRARRGRRSSSASRWTTAARRSSCRPARSSTARRAAPCCCARSTT